jgi:hypothetical protein
MNLDYEKTMSRILPIHPDTVNVKWDEESFKFQAQKHCKSFFVIVHRCLDVKIRTPQQVESCKRAPELLDRCVSDVLNDMNRIAEMKRKGLIS